MIKQSIFLLSFLLGIICAHNGFTVIDPSPNEDANWRLFAEATKKAPEEPSEEASKLNPTNYGFE